MGASVTTVQEQVTCEVFLHFLLASYILILFLHVSIIFLINAISFLFSIFTTPCPLNG